MAEGAAESVLLETERLMLRQFTMCDGDNLAALDADPDVMLYHQRAGQIPRRDHGQPLPGFMAWYRRSGR